MLRRRHVARQGRRIRGHGRHRRRRAACQQRRVTSWRKARSGVTRATGRSVRWTATMNRCWSSRKQYSGKAAGGVDGRRSTGVVYRGRRHHARVTKEKATCIWGEMRGAAVALGELRQHPRKGVRGRPMCIVDLLICLKLSVCHHI